MLVHCGTNVEFIKSSGHSNDDKPSFINVCDYAFVYDRKLLNNKQYSCMAVSEIV